MSGPGFLVWNPSRSLPTVQHDTFARAQAERDRLAAVNPGETFIVMAPARTARSMEAAEALSAGLQQGREAMREDVRWAERRAEEAYEQARVLRRRLRALEPIEAKADESQAIVADCILWFDGFNAAHAHREGYERPHTPDRQKLCDLNAALQKLMREAAERAIEEEIPF